MIIAIPRPREKCLALLLQYIQMLKIVSLCFENYCISRSHKIQQECFYCNARQITGTHSEVRMDMGCNKERVTVVWYYMTYLFVSLYKLGVALVVFPLFHSLMLF